MSTHFISFTRDDGSEVEIEYSAHGGSPYGSAPTLTYPGDPPEAPEFEIRKVLDDLSRSVVLTDAENERAYHEIDHEIDDGWEWPEDDYGDD